LKIKMSTAKPETLIYTVWMLFDRKVPAVFLLFTAIIVSIFVWFKAGSVLLALAAFALFLLPLLPMFFPVQYELNADGVLIGGIIRRRMNWHEIYRYDVRQNGVLLLPQREHFILEAFNGIFLPVPEELMPEVIYRLRFFVDNLSE